MYKCQACGKQSKQGERAYRRVTLARKVIYQPRASANRGGNDDPGGRGYQAVKEITVGECCNRFSDIFVK